MTDDVERGSTPILPDLLGHREWLRTVDQNAKTWKVVERFLSAVIAETDEDAHEATSIPWSAVNETFMSKGDDEPPSALTKVLKADVRTNWMDARLSGYLAYCAQHGVEPVRFVEISGRPTRYTFQRMRHDETSGCRPWRTDGAVVRWTRTLVPADQISRFGRLFYPDGRFVMKGWRKWATFADASLSTAAFVLMTLSAWLCLMGIGFGGSAARAMSLSGFCVYSALVAWFFFGHMKPKIRSLDLRTQPAHPLFVGLRQGVWTDRINGNQGRDKDDALYDASVIPYRELVRWSADCPICEAPLELKDDSPVLKGALVGCCFESPDEHCFTFDRVTLEGRALRARPSQK